ncbi:PQQ-binding-like beta-propeller repeat protein [Puniceicoccaceae bacterium K14]|nr:PQQ-binding-like beta-propeller repeat protein [Puniceicoccaceae bacterium K14]
MITKIHDSILFQRTRKTDSFARLLGHIRVILLFSFYGLISAQAADVKKPKLIWEHSREDGFAYSSPVVYDGKIYVGSRNGEFYAIDDSTYETLWFFQTDGEIHGSSLVTEEWVYFQSDDNHLYKLNRASGELVWSYESSEESFVRDVSILDHGSSVPVLKDSRIFFGTNGGEMICLDAVNGEEIWVYAATGFIRSTPVISDGKVFFGCYGPSMYSIYENSGELVWKTDFEVTSDVRKPVMPSAVVHGDLVFLGLRDTFLYAMNTDTGNVEWSSEFPSSWVEATGVIVDGKLYIGSSDLSAVRCYNPNTGEVIWQRSVPGRTYGKPAYWDGHLIYGISGHTTSKPDYASASIALNIETGDIAWIREEDHPSDSSFGRFGVFGDLHEANGRLYYSNQSGKLFVYDLDPAPYLLNISTRGRVGTGDDVLIAGFVIKGNVMKKILLQGIGPSLEGQGVVGYLNDPKITLYKGDEFLAENDVWRKWPGAVDLRTAATDIGATELSANDAAMLIDLDEGAYTVHLSSLSSDEGVALVEAYEIR